MIVSVEAKQEFLIWLINNVSFRRREVHWIMNYLVNHEAILQNVHFVENVAVTKRGIVFKDAATTGEPVLLYLDGKTFNDSDQIFHEIRMHWQRPLYLECITSGLWQNEKYVAVLEDNPSDSWNEKVSPEIIAEVDRFLSEDELRVQQEHLYQEIDAALESGDKKRFIELSEELKNLKANGHQEVEVSR